MAKQTIAQNWKSTETDFNPATQQFITTTKNIGYFTQATVTKRIATIAAKRGYVWTPKHFHGFGGYWVRSDGSTLEVAPGRA